MFIIFYILNKNKANNISDNSLTTIMSTLDPIVTTLTLVLLRVDVDMVYCQRNHGFVVYGFYSTSSKCLHPYCTET